ncbi:MAG: VWA domain-containing protein [Terriglobia bacterium]|jgi:VWFA-related protein
MTALFSIACAAFPASGGAAPGSPPAQSSTQTQPTFQIQSKTNVVVVRVVVRDAKGKPVDGLTQNDFQLFDNGKLQTVAQFAVEHPVASAEKAPATASERLAQPSELQPTFAAPERFVALYIDDTRARSEDLARVREAGLRFLANGIRSQDRLGIFTTSGFVNQDYTSDHTKLEAALAKLQYRPNTGDPRGECPELSDYQADLIANHEDPDAVTIAVNEAIKRGCAPTHGGAGARAIGLTTAGDVGGVKEVILARAKQVFELYDLQAHTSLYTLQEMIRRVAQLPGQREIVLVTPGFMPLTFRSMLEDAADLAVRSNVVIGALDPRGLVNTVQTADAGDQQFNIDSDSDRREETSVRMNYEQMRDWAAWAVPAELAAATGGEAIHNTNDLAAGLVGVSAPPPVSYTLAYSPTDLKSDGKFHTLKVRLNNERGLIVDARKGYFAPREVPSAQEQIDAQIKEAAYSAGETMELPVNLQTQFFKTKAGGAQLTLIARVDARGLSFRKEGTTDTNHLRFVAVVFDEDGNYVTGQQKDLDVTVSDASLAELRTQGLSMRTIFALVPGSYLVRQVVRDSEGGHLTALSRTVVIPR